MKEGSCLVKTNKILAENSNNKTGWQEGTLGSEKRLQPRVEGGLGVEIASQMSNIKGSEVTEKRLKGHVLSVCFCVLHWLNAAGLSVDPRTKEGGGTLQQRPLVPVVSLSGIIGPHLLVSSGRILTALLV